jgi:AcrR family transcriptional regulator
MTDAPKRTKQSTDTRQAGLIEAALTLAARRNPADITTTDLAHEVGITQGAVFRHFANKEAIWLAVMEWVVDQLMQRLQAAAASNGHTDPLRALQDVFMAHVEFVMAYPGVPRVIFQELQHPDETPLKAAVRNLMQRYRVLVSSLLANAAQMNLLARGTDANAASVLFIGSMQGLVMQSLVNGQVHTIAAQAPGVFSIYLRGITLKEHP